MFSLRYGKRPIVEESQIVSAGVCIRNYLLETGVSLTLNNEKDIKDLISMIELNSKFNLKKEVNGDYEYSEPNSVKLTYTQSNLGNGFVFWFICNLCNRRAKYLYFPPNSTILACRRCHRLSYEKQNASKKYRDYFNLLR